MPTQISKLYNRLEDGPQGEPSLAEIVHHFLLAICTRPGSGVCFKTKGWYPRQTPASEDTSARRPDTVHNRILASFIKSLSPNDDLRQQELVLKILEVCPELVPG